MNFLIGDGSGRKYRDNQINYLTHLTKVWKSHQYFVLNAAPGTGKSMVARSINNAIEDSAIITPSNNLVHQYCESYPELVPIIGKEHYESEDEYKACKSRIDNGAPAIFNPISFYYHYIQRPEDRPSVVIIDEAHKLADMLVMTISQTFACHYYGIPKDLNDQGFLDWLSERISKLEKLKSVEKFKKQYERLGLLQAYLKDNLKNIRIDYQMIPNFRTRSKELHLSVTPLTFPTDLLHTIFGKETKIVFMSGTMFPIHMKELGLEKFDYKEYVSPCPVANRHISAYSKLERSNVAQLADAITKSRISLRQPATLVHVPYNQQAEYKKYLGKVITHTKDTKESALRRFKKNGGILLASGMAEGVDLPGDQCRLAIIPKLLYPNLGDDAVKKRMKMPDGQTWYSMQTLVTTIQQIYRGVRGKDDWCVIVILDPTFKRLVTKMKKHLPQDFLESIKWS